MNGLWNMKDSLEQNGSTKSLCIYRRQDSGGGSSRDEASEELSPGVLSAGRAPCMLQVLFM